MEERPVSTTELSGQARPRASTISGSLEFASDLLRTLAASPIVMEVLTMWSESPGRKHQLTAPDDGSFAIGRVAIEVRGDLDIATAPRFAKLLNDVAGAGPTEIALDLADLTFMDASGLTAMASAAQHLPAASSLTLRSPSTLVERLLTITGLQGLIKVDRSLRQETLAPEQQAGDTDATVHEHLQGALNSREAISRAEGFLMGQRSISQAAASADLRRSARRAESPVHEYALTVTASGAPRAAPLDHDSP